MRNFKKVRKNKNSKTVKEIRNVKIIIGLVIILLLSVTFVFAQGKSDHSEQPEISSQPAQPEHPANPAHPEQAQNADKGDNSNGGSGQGQDNGDFSSNGKSDFGQQTAMEHSARICDHGSNENVGCHSHVIIEPDGTPKVSVNPAGYTPSQFHSAYVLPSTISTTTLPIIAIVDAYDHPNALSDLNTYSSQFGIPTLPTCSGSIRTDSRACFQKVDQRGGSRYPTQNAGWGLEISLDIEIAHAICQNCKILLVEADSNSLSNLTSAVDRAVNLGAKVVSNSYGSSEFSGETAYDSHFSYPGVAMVVSSGDSGYGAEYPAASNAVVAVGGTSLLLNSDNSYRSETAWSGAGSGCSAYESKPSWQHDGVCARRSIADVSADADPSSGAAVYDSFRYQGKNGWFKVGGTSLASPLIAGVYALGSRNISNSSLAPYLPYAFGITSSTINDVTLGSSGSCGNYLCNATTGYDGPTGLGSPIGVSAF